MFKPFSVTGCSLELLQVGEQGIVTCCNIQDETIREKLKSMGLNPGISISIEQRFPAFKIKLGNINVTIDRKIARRIYVRIINN